MEEFQKPTSSLLTPPEALQQLDAMEQIERQKGAFDSEGDAFNAIRVSLQTGNIGPEEAIARARKIAESRQDYH